MNLYLKDKIAFIAGSSRGIGKAIAKGLAEEGCKVILTGRDQTSLDATVQEFQAAFGRDHILGLVGDLGETATAIDIIHKSVSLFSRIDILVANIGSGRGKPGYDLPDTEWDRFYQINLLSNIRVARAAIPYMINNGSGSIIFIASIAGIETLGAPIAYEASKASVIVASKSLSRELALYNIRVNCVAPGNIMFPGSTWDQKIRENEKEVTEYIALNVPLRRFGSPQEIAGIVIFLASDRASFITGACIVADGGQMRSF